MFSRASDANEFRIIIFNELGHGFKLGSQKNILSGLPREFMGGATRNLKMSFSLDVFTYE